MAKTRRTQGAGGSETSAKRGQRNPPPGRRNPIFVFFPAMERTKDHRGLSPRSASAPVANPGPRYGGRFPGSCSSNPAREVQLIVPASAPLPLAGIFQESRASWTRKARRLPPAVGAGSGTARLNSMAQARRTQGAGQAETSAKPGPSGPEGEWAATQILPAGRDFLPKGPHPKRRFGSFAAVGKGTRRRGGGTLPREPEQLEKERTSGASSCGG